MTAHPQIIFKAVLIFTDLLQLHFCLAHKNSHRAIIEYQKKKKKEKEKEKENLKRMFTKNLHTFQFRIIFQTIYSFLIHPVFKYVY